MYSLGRFRAQADMDPSSNDEIIAAACVGKGVKATGLLLSIELECSSASDDILIMRA